MKEIFINKNELIEVLQKTSFFNYLDENDQTGFIGISQINEYENGEIIIMPGQKNPYYHVVISGTINVNLDKKNKKIYITTLGAGDVVGDISMFADFENTTGMSAYNKVRVLRIHRKDFGAFIMKRPETGIKILVAIIHSFLTRLRCANQNFMLDRSVSADHKIMEKFISEYYDVKGE